MPLQVYIDLIQSFVDGRIDADAFERAFLDLFSSDRCVRAKSHHELLDQMFGAVDAYVSEPRLRRKPEDLGPEQLRAEASDILRQLEAVSL